MFDPTASKYYPKEGERFANDTKDHKMKVLHDDGLYRHLVFKRPDSSFYWFEIITWPGNLLFGGDMGTFAFKRVEDMFTFFSDREINPQYWQEKVHAEDVNGGIQEYSETLFKKRVKEYLDDYIKDNDLSKKSAKDLREKIAFHMELADTSTDYSAHDFLYNFAMHEDKENFEFYESYEWNFKEYTFRFIWCCFAICWAISKYNESKTEQEKTA